MKPIEKTANDLFQTLRTRFSPLNVGDENAEVTVDPASARFFSFMYKENDKELGPVSISIVNNRSLKIYYSNDMVEGMQNTAEWYALLKELRYFAKQNLLSFDARNIQKDQLDTRDFNFLKVNDGPYQEKDVEITESAMFGSKRKSMQRFENATLIVNHKKAVDEAVRGSRSRYIESIFIENNGERFRFPINYLNGARAMAVHVSEGGTPYDAIGQHIISTVTEMQNLAKFARMTKGHAMEDTEAAGIRDCVVEAYHTIKKDIMRMQNVKNYRSFSETFSPAEAAGDADVTTLQEKFTRKIWNEKMNELLPSVQRALNTKVNEEYDNEYDDEYEDEYEDEEVNDSDQEYFEQVAVELGNILGSPVTLQDYEQGDDLRSMHFVIDGKPVWLHQSWRQDGSSGKPVTYLDDEALGRFAIWWNNPRNYAKDLASVWNEMSHDDDVDEGFDVDAGGNRISSKQFDVDAGGNRIFNGDDDILNSPNKIEIGHPEDYNAPPWQIRTTIHGKVVYDGNNYDVDGKIYRSVDAYVRALAKKYNVSVNSFDLYEIGSDGKSSLQTRRFIPRRGVTEISKKTLGSYSDKAKAQRGAGKDREKSIGLAYRKSTPDKRASSKYDPEPRVRATEAQVNEASPSVEKSIKNPNFALILKKDDAADAMIRRTKFTRADGLLAFIMSDIASRIIGNEADAVANFASEMSINIGDEGASFGTKITPEYKRDKQLAMLLAKKYLDDLKRIATDPAFAASVRKDPKDVYGAKKVRGGGYHEAVDTFESWANEIVEATTVGTTGTTGTTGMPKVGTTNPQVVKALSGGDANKARDIKRVSDKLAKGQRLSPQEQPIAGEIAKNVMTTKKSTAAMQALAQDKYTNIGATESIVTEKTLKVKAERDFDGDGEIETPQEEYRGSKDRAIKKSVKPMENSEQDLIKESLALLKRFAGL